jgi:REP element-mobilizing transposase RayT
MSIRLKHSSIYSTYYCTFTNYKWLELFKITNGYDLVYEWFHHLRQDKIADIIAYVVMPNHLHTILYFEHDHFDINKVISNGKRFMAYKIIDRLISLNNLSILKMLSDGVSERERKKGQLHKVFENSFDGKPIFSENFLIQKLNYIHHNPVSGKWNLVENFIDYEHSSASFYETGEVKWFRPLHYLG